MRNLLFATHNEHKLVEIREKLSDNHTLKIISLKDIGFTQDVPETGITLVENALQKVRYLYERTHVDVFADDTGLEVESLNYAPGVYSARYAGEQKNSLANIKLLLQNLQGKENRNACFKTVIALIYRGQEYLFEGRIDGIITNSPRGNEGFGYDPIFQPLHSKQTFAEMALSEKNMISHRALAVAKLRHFFINN